MSVAGLTAQAVGAGDDSEIRLGLIRALLLGAAIGLLMVFAQIPIGAIAFRLLAIGSQASDTTFDSAQTYFSIRIWGAPFALATYGCLGWLTARARTDFLMITALAMTFINIALDLLFVLTFNWGAAGIAAGTLIAEISGFAISFGLVCLMLKRDALLDFRVSRASLFDGEKLRRTLSVNRDIFVRTLLLAFSFAWFVQRGSAFGDVTLAANQVLLQLFLISGLALDGTAIAAETLVGQALGNAQQSGNSTQMRATAFTTYRQIVRRSFILATIAALTFVVLYGALGHGLLRLLTPEGAILSDARQYWPWIIISPLIVMICFQLDGIFVGATRSTEMRDSMIISVFIFIPLSLYLPAIMGNHGLWLAFSIYFMMRAIGLGAFLPRISRDFEHEPTAKLK